MLPDDLVSQGRHVLTVCNSCRYCEGYCPVFPAMERRTSFTVVDITYLANLCHNCGECLYACQYAPPHEFGINVPRTLAEVRLASYENYCWPRFLAPLFRRAGVTTAIGTALVATMAVWAMAFASAQPAAPAGGGNFYAVIPHDAMVVLFGGVSLFVVVALAVGLFRFRRDLQDGQPGDGEASSVSRGLRDALTLTHLHGSGADCTDAEERRSPLRRWFHHLTFYGFALCFASTCVAAVYHVVLGWPAPYAWTSLPVVLGTAGGLGLVAGPVGLFTMRQRRDPALTDPAQQGLDFGFIALLLLTAITGLLLLVLRDGAAMRPLLMIHLGCVLALFVSLPYGKFVHAGYRTLALVKYAKDNADA